MSKLDDLAKLVVAIIEKKDSKKPKALDTVGTVTRVDGDYAYIRFAGSDGETPVKETITVKKGDKVQVRSSKGSAWIVGNETAPPTDDTLAKKAMENSDKAGKVAKRASDMTIVNDTLYYLASDQDEGVTVEDEGWTKEPQEVSESLPYLWAYHDYERGNGTHFKSDPVIIAMYAEDGVGVVSVETYYYVSTSQYQLIGGSWGTTYNYVSGTYIWRKELITHDDGTTTWTTALYDSGLTKSLELAYDTAQYIWTQTNTSDTNIPTGQYVTEYPKARYTNQSDTNYYCKGGSLLLRSAALYLRQGANKLVELVQAGLKIYEPNDTTNPVAQFLSSGAVIGKESETHVGVDSDGLKFYYANDNNVYARMLPLSTSSGNLGLLIENVNAPNSANITMDNSRTSRSTITLSAGGSGTHAAVVIDGKTERVIVTGRLVTEALDATEDTGLFKITSTSITVPSISASGSTGTLTKNAGTSSDAKYYPLAIAGFRTGKAAITFVRLLLQNPTTGGATISYNLHNTSSSATDATTGEVQILWVKNTV